MNNPNTPYLRLLGQPREFPVVSLFSGAMGLDLGLMEAGLHVVVGQDYDPWCVETITRNNHVVVPGDIRNLVNADPRCKFLLEAGGLKKKDIFAVVGGPPCQAFSTAGRRKGAEDERGSLFREFIHVVSELRPRFFVMENVKGLVSMPSIPGDKSSPKLLQTIFDELRRLKYRTVSGVLDAVHYGAPEFRERLVIIGSRDNEPVFLPAPTHFQFHQSPSMRWRTLFDAIAEVEKRPGPGATFTPRIQHFLKMVPEGGNWRSLPQRLQKEAMGGAFESGGGKVGFYRRLRYDQPSPTLVTIPTQKATILCHPKVTRPLSVDEYRRIQGFPDGWRLEGKSVDLYRQIGNAVPVPLGKAIGQMLLAVASNTAEIRVRRTRGTSVHGQMVNLKDALIGATLDE